MEYPKRNGNSFMFDYEKNNMYSGEEHRIKVPAPTPNMRSINDIAYIKSAGVKIYATISADVNNAVWVEIQDGHDVNKCTKYIKIVSQSAGQYICFRFSLN